MHFWSLDESLEAGNCPRVLASSPGQTWLLPLVRVWDLLGAGGGPKGTDRVRPENKMD